MRTWVRHVMGGMAALLVAASANAQGTEGTTPGGTIAFLGGGATTSSTAGPLAGATVVYDVNERLSVEGQGAWLGRGSGSEAISLNGSVLVNILPLGNRFVPYAAIGGGMYRASFDLTNARLLGLVGGQFGPGTQFCPSAGTGYMHGAGPGFGTCAVDTASGWWGVGNMPRFYAQRLGMLVIPEGGAWQHRTFTDPSMTFGGGVRFNLAKHLELRPDARAIVVLDGGNGYTVGVFGVNIGYSF